MRNLRKGGITIVSLLLCVACLLCNAAPAFAVPTTPEPAGTLTSLVRMTPKADGAPIGQLENGTVLTVLGTKGSFYQIDCYDMTGYIAKNQVAKNEAGECYVNCDEASADTCFFTYTDPAQALQLRHDILALAKKQLGSRYVYGGMTPGGFDCSGLTLYLYQKQGIDLHRRASLQLQNGIIVPKEAMQVGDLVFFRQGTKNPASHVGIYAGNNQIIHAGTSTGVVYSDLDLGYFEEYFLCVRRVISTRTVQEQQPMARTVTTTLEVNSVSGRSIP